MREFRYMDLTQLNKMETEITEAQQRVSQATAQFLCQSDKALQPFKTQLTTFEQQIEKAQKTVLSLMYQ